VWATYFRINAFIRVLPVPDGMQWTTQQKRNIDFVREIMDYLMY
jgi:hypothetical protein